MKVLQSSLSQLFLDSIFPTSTSTCNTITMIFYQKKDAARTKFMPTLLQSNKYLPCD